MLEIIKDNNNNIKAVCEWSLVDCNGHFDTKGEYIWINNIFINPEERGNGMIKRFTKKITDKVPWFRYGYFKRSKYNERHRIYDRNQWLRLINKEE